MFEALHADAALVVSPVFVDGRDVPVAREPVPERLVANVAFEVLLGPAALFGVRLPVAAAVKVLATVLAIQILSDDLYIILFGLLRPLQLLGLCCSLGLFGVLRFL